MGGVIQFWWCDTMHHDTGVTIQCIEINCVIQRINNQILVC